MTSIPVKKGLTLRRKEAFQDQTHSVALEARDWLLHTLELPATDASTSKKAQVEAFFASIDNGVLLCQLAMKIQPSLAISYKADVKTESFQARDNIIKFLAACKTLGVPAISIFETDDLVARKNQLLVVNTLLYLARIGARAGFVPPPIVQYEIEIEEANEAKEGAAGAPDEEDDAYEEPPAATSALSWTPIAAATSTSSTSSTSASSSGPISSPVADSTTEVKAAKPKKSVGFAADDDEPHAAPPAAIAASPTAASPTSEASSPVWSSSTSSSPVSPGRPQYIPEAGNATDIAVARVINFHNFSVAVVRLAMKKGRKHDHRHRGKGDYKIAGEKMFVRLIQGEVMVRYLGEWEELAQFLADLDRQ